MDENQRNFKAKFTSADANKDGRLDQQEFGAFVHPQRHDHMVDHLVEDQLHTYDKDGNGMISRREFMGEKKCSSLHCVWGRVYVCILVVTTTINEKAS